VLTGALANRLVDRIRSPLFLDRFLAKGRYSALMARISLKVASHAEPGLLGAAVAFQKAQAK
jgi:glucokinase